MNDFSTQGLGVAIGSQAGVAGSAGINVITINTAASIGSQHDRHLDFGGLTVAGRQRRDASEHRLHRRRRLATAGTGAAIDVNVLDNPTNAFLASSVRANVADATQISAESSLTPSHDPVPNSPSDTIIASGTLTAGQLSVAGIDGSVLGVLGGNAIHAVQRRARHRHRRPARDGDHGDPQYAVRRGSDVRIECRDSDDPVFVNPEDVLIVPKAGDTVSGPGILPGTTIVSVTTNLLATTITLSLPAIANGAAPLTASDLVLSRDATTSGPTTLTETLTPDPIDALAMAISSLPASAPPDEFRRGRRAHPAARASPARSSST